MTTWRQDDAGAKALYRQPGNVLHFSPSEGFTPQPKMHNSFSTMQCFDCVIVWDDSLNEGKGGKRVVCPIIGRRENLMSGLFTKTHILFSSHECVSELFRSDPAFKSKWPRLLSQADVRICDEMITEPCASCDSQAKMYEGWLLFGPSRRDYDWDGEAVTAARFSVNLKATAAAATAAAFAAPSNEETSNGEGGEQGGEGGGDTMAGKAVGEHAVCGAQVFWDELTREPIHLREKYQGPAELEPLLLQLYMGEKEMKERHSARHMPCIPDPVIRGEEREVGLFNFMHAFRDVPLTSEKFSPSGIRHKIAVHGWGEEATEGEADSLIVYPRSTRRCFDYMMDEDYLFHCANGAGEDRHIRQGALLLQDREYGRLDDMIGNVIKKAGMSTNIINEFWSVCDESVFMAQPDIVDEEGSVDATTTGNKNGIERERRRKRISENALFAFSVPVTIALPMYRCIVLTVVYALLTFFILFLLFLLFRLFLLFPPSPLPRPLVPFPLPPPPQEVTTIRPRTP